MAKKRYKKVLRILGVCGAGTVTSTMVAMRVEDVCDEEGIRCIVDEVRPTQVHSTLETAHFDLIITTSPIPDVEKIKVLIIDGHPLLSGFGEEETLEEIRMTALKIVKEFEQKISK